MTFCFAKRKHSKRKRKTGRRENLRETEWKNKRKIQSEILRAYNPKKYAAKDNTEAALRVAGDW